MWLILNQRFKSRFAHKLWVTVNLLQIEQTFREQSIIESFTANRSIFTGYRPRIWLQKKLQSIFVMKLEHFRQFSLFRAQSIRFYPRDVAGLWQWKMVCFSWSQCSQIDGILRSSRNASFSMRLSLSLSRFLHPKNLLRLSSKAFYQIKI